MTRLALVAALLLTAPPEEAAPMHRIDHATRLEDANGAGRDGFTEGNPATQTPATVVTAKWANSVQEEIARAVEAFGGTLDPNDNGQLAAVLAELGGDLFTTEHTWSAKQKFTAAYLANNFGVSGEILYCDPGDGDPAPREREVYIPLAWARPESGALWTMASGFPTDGATLTDTLTAPGNSTLRWEVRVPGDTRITRVRADLNGYTNTMSLYAGRKRHAGSPFHTSTFNRLAAAASIPNAGNGIYGAATLSLTGDLTFGNADTLAIYINAQAAGQLVYWLALTVQDAGPRSW